MNDYEQAQIDILRERLNIDRDKLKLDQPLLTRYFAATTGFVSVVISAAAIIATNLNNHNQIKLASESHKDEMGIKTEEAKHAWSIQAADFVTHNQDALFGDNESKKAQACGVIVACFPVEISNPLLKQIQSAAPKSTQIDNAVDEAKKLLDTRTKALSSKGPPFGYRFSRDSPQIWTHYEGKRIWVSDAAGITGGLDCPIEPLGAFIEEDVHHYYKAGTIYER